MKKNLKKSIISFLMIALTVTFIGCSKDEQENPGKVDGNENITVTAEPVKDTPIPTPTSEPKPTEAVDTKSVLDEKQSAGNLKNDQDSNPAEPTPTEIQEPVVTGDAEPTEIPVVTEDPDYWDYSYGDTFDTRYTEFDGTDENAVKVAEDFARAYVFGDKELIKETMACDPEFEEQFDQDSKDWHGYRSFFETYMGIENIDIMDMNLDGILDLKAIGGTKVDISEILYWIDPYEVYVEDMSTWDNYQIITIDFQGLLAYVISDYEGEGINVIVAEKNGQYKALDVEYYEIDDAEISTDELQKLLDENKSALTGNESADDILNMYAEGLEKFDFFKLFSLTAIDEDKEIALLADNMYIFSAFEMYNRLKPGVLSATLTRSDAIELDDSEIAEVLNAYDLVDDKESITDVVKYEFRLHSTQNGEDYDDDFVNYIGKFNGEYRIIDNYMFN